MTDPVGNDPVPQAPTSDGAAPQPSAAEKIRDFEQWLITPDPITGILERAQMLRDWMNDVLMQDDEDTVVTHHTLRYMQADLAMLTATDPRANFKPKPKYWAPPGQPNIAPPTYIRFAETTELLVNFFVQNGNLRDSANAAARAAKTTRAGWVKLIWRDDPERTPTGAQIHDEKLNAMFKFRYLRDRFKAGEFGEDSADYTSMQELDRYLRGELVTQYRQQKTPASAVVVEGPEGVDVVASIDPIDKRVMELLQGAEFTDAELDDVPRYLGFDFDPINIEDIRVDWGSINNPEFYHLSSRIAHRTRKTKAEVIGAYKLTPEQQAMLPATDDEPHQDRVLDEQRQAEQAGDQIERPQINDGKFDVWELWDRADRTVYVFIPGTDFWLTTFTPRNTGPQWYPFFYLWFNELDGWFYAPSDAELLMPLQDEFNSTRSHAREYRKAALPRLLIAKGVMSGPEIDKFENSHPYQVIEVEKPDEIQSSLFKFDGVDYNPALVSTADVLMEMQMMAGMPASGLGGVGSAKLATEVSFAGQQLKSQQDRKMYLFRRFLSRIVVEMAHIIVRALPRENAVQIAGPGIVFPQSLEEREGLLAELVLDVSVSPAGKPDVDSELNHLMMVSQIMREHGMLMPPQFLASMLGDITGQVLDFSGIQQDPALAAGGGPRPPRPSEGLRTGGPSGPAPGTPNGGLPGMPRPSSLPGGAPRR
jgi:hypothetical protein